MAAKKKTKKKRSTKKKAKRKAAAKKAPAKPRKEKRPPVADQVQPGTPDSIITLIERQLDRAWAAHCRIQKEGEVVRDMKGSVIPHPAIEIERAATKQASDLLAKHRRMGIHR